MSKMQIISDNAPREAGLEQVVNVILKSKNPLQDICLKLGHLLYDENLINFRGMMGRLDASSFIELIQSERKKFLADGITPSYGDPLAFVMEGDDYLAHSKEQKKHYFWFADQLYHLVLPELNAYNASFGISVFPEETTSIDEKEQMMNELDHPRFPRNYAHVKTLLLYDKKSNKHYLIVVGGIQRADLAKIKRELNVQDLRFSDNPQEIIGRQSGAVSPFIQEQFFPNVEKILFAEELMAGYSKPHYSIPIDKRSAFVIADISDLLRELRKIDGFPEISTFNNACKTKTISAY